ncbi:hypothetical protein J2S25_001127 [Mesobacillus stamsii]|uniref:Uncharacterized protein n=1 Tax=Mesobacillus stamsii TaxID=225347 RepID=A0ABU0FT69_9BACI|nr:hypothetical protein [Mesobacillus stamsii]
MTESIFMEQTSEVHLQSWHRDRFYRSVKMHRHKPLS